MRQIGLISLIGLIWAAQAAFTFSSQTQIRYEELAESVRNPFWLSQGLIYDGVSTNVGWYGTLLGIYKLFGFDIHTAKIFRLVLAGVSSACLALLLRRFLGKNAWLPLLTIGLSPTLLYFNTLQTSYGIDLQYLPIVLFLLISPIGPIRLIGWALAMVAWMSYPTFVFYLPVLAVWFLHPRGARAHPGGVFSPGGVLGLVVTLGAFLAPLVLAFAFVKNRSLLIYDETVRSGIFRGAGGEGLALVDFSRNLGGFFRDLFIQGNSYHFELYRPEFSDIYPVLIVLFVIGISLFLAFKGKREIRLISLIGLIGLIGVLVLSSLTSDPSGAPGMRRYTPFLAAFYALFTFVWLWSNSTNWTNWITKGSLFLLLLHHLIVFPINLSHIKDPSPIKEPIWFTLRETPRESLDFLQEQAKMGKLNFSCVDPSGTPFYCRYVEGYAAVAGSCLWNNLDCGEIRGYDFKTDKSIPLSVDLWNDYYFEH